MSNECQTSVAENSKYLARKYAENNNFGRAYCHYLVTLMLKPELKSVLEEEFISALYKWGLTLEKEGKVADLLQCYEQAISIFSDNVILLNNIGAHLLRCHLLKEAGRYFEKCLNLKPNFLRARHNLDNLANLAVERWHFRMLNDSHRNHAFREAIRKKIAQGFDRVLDIGTGTGLLSLFCFEGNAREIYACDSSVIMIEIAKKVFSENRADRIQLINKHSTEIRVPCDIPERVSLIVTETFDSGLLGEGILMTLSHAWQNLLLIPNPTNGVSSGQVIPFGGQLYVAAVECNSVRKRFRGSLEKAMLPCDDTYPYLTRSPGDYDTQDLSLVDYKNLTHPEKLPFIRFNEPEEIEKVLSGHLDGEVKLLCSESGRLDGFAVWFDLLLDEDISLNTGSKSTSNEAWEQAVFPSAGKCLFVQKGQEIRIRMSFKTGKLVVDHVVENSSPSMKASESLIKTINDQEMRNRLIKVSNELSDSLDQPVRIMDWFPFPVFGLTFLKARKNKFVDELLCFVGSDEDEEAVRYFVNEHELEDRVTVKKDTCIENHNFMKGEFDVIVLNLVESTGEMKENCAIYLMNFRTLLKPNGILLPEEVTVIGQLIHSEWLLKASKVISDKQTCGYNVGKHLNAYQVQHFIDIDCQFNKVDVSFPVPLFCVTEKEICFDIDIPVIENVIVPVNALLYWFKIKLTKDSEDVYTNNRTSGFNISAFIFPETEIKSRNTLKCGIVANGGLFRIALLNE